MDRTQTPERCDQPLVGFPAPLPDELLYSTIGRYAAMFSLSGGPLKRAVWGTQSGTAVIDFPTGLRGLSRRLPTLGIFEEAQLIHAHTLTPYYLRFVRPSLADELRARLLDGPAQGLHGLVFSRRGQVHRPSHLQFCVRCAREDREQLGWSYWHRLHQMPGVLLCPTHKEALRASEIPRTADRVRHRYVLCDPDSALAKLRLPSGHRDDLLNIACRTRELLDLPAWSLAPSASRAWYREFLEESGWVNRYGRLGVEAISRMVRDRFGPALLEHLGCSLVGKYTWVRRMISDGERREHPLRHILLLVALDVPTDALLSDPRLLAHTRGQAVREAPCRFPGCHAYGTQTAQRASAQTPLQVRVLCPQCRFEYVYQRTNAAQWRIVTPGDQWLHVVRLLRRSGASWREIARRLQVPLAALNEQRAKHKLELPATADGVRWNHLALSKQAEREEHRAKSRRWFRRVRREHPSWSRTRLCSDSPRFYAWLTRNDRSWLVSQLPSRRSAGGHGTGRDWSALDESLEARVAPLAAEFVSRDERPQWVTIKALSRGLGHSYGFVIRNLKKLPRTSAAIREVQRMYNGDALLRRRLQWAADQCRIESASPSYSAICRLARTTVGRARTLVDLDRLPELPGDSRQRAC